MGSREPVGAAGMTVKRGPKWPWFSALRGPESGLAGKMKQIEAPNRGQNPKEYPRNLGNPPLPRARVRARFTPLPRARVRARFIVEKLARPHLSPRATAAPRRRPKHTPQPMGQPPVLPETIEQTAAAMRSTITKPQRRAVACLIASTECVTIESITPTEIC